MEVLRLKEVLKEKKVTGKELAIKVGVTAASISNLVKGDSIPRKDLLLSIANSLDVDVKDLFTSTKEKESLNGFIEYKGEVHRIKNKEDLDQLIKKLD